jgi:protein involved in polysaccharide export with SLBB domain
MRPIPGSLAGLLGIGCFAFGAVAGAGAETTSVDSARARELFAEQASPGSASAEEIAAALRAQGIPVDSLQAAGSREVIPGTDPSAPDSVPADRVEQAPPRVSGTQPAEPGELALFGYSLFSTSPDSYRQPGYGPMDPEYPLGPGDEIVLDVWGDTVFRLERTLDRQGAVNLPDVGRVVLAGMTLEEVRSALRQRLGRVYSGLAEEGGRATTHLAVTLGDLRVIRAFVVGRAVRPGGYDLSAAATVFHALFFAGGPSETGSLRDIRLVRGGTVVGSLDVYDYLRSGRRDGDLRLENDDTIFIPPAGPRVTVRGEVREPGIYELLPGETLGNLLATAGGLTERAYAGRVQIERILSTEEQGRTGEDRKLLDFALDEAADARELRDGDQVTVFPIADRIRNFVTVRGEVRRPGTYELRDGARLADLIREAGGLLETAFLERAEVVRTYEDQRREQFGVDLTRAMSGDAAGNLALRPRDEVTVHSLWALRDPEEVSIYGAVRSPGSYELRQSMTLRDLVLQAGGFGERAFLEYAEVSRVEPGAEAGRGAEILRVPLGADFLARQEDDFRLRAYDNVFIREDPDYELQRNVTVTGEVRFPGVYSLVRPTETVAEVVARAGGLEETAYAEGFQLHREKGGIGRVALDLKRALKDPRSKDNVILFAGDSLHVPQEPKTVTVRGAVGYPTSLVFDPGWSIGDYVAHAGGTTDRADRGQTRVIYTTGAAARVKRFWFDPEVRPGSTIIVPEKLERDVDWGDVLKNTTSILASLATVVLVADRVAN